MGLIRAFVKSFLCLLLGTMSSQVYAISAEALEFKCATKRKEGIITQLQAQSSSPAEAAAIAKCISSVSNTFHMCSKTINTAAATGGGAAAANTQGVNKEFQAQKQIAGTTSQLSQADMIANQSCSKTAKSSQSSCSKYGSAKGYLGEIDSKCTADAQTAANNTQNLDQLESADEELASSSQPSMPQSPPAAPAAPPAQNTPPLELSNYTPDGTEAASSSSSPNFVPPTLPDFTTAAKNLTDDEKNDSKKDAPVYSAGSFPAFSQAYEDLTGKEPSPEEVENFVASAGTGAASGGSSGSLMGGGSGSVAGVGSSGNKADAEALSDGSGSGGGGGFNSGGGLSLASFNPNMPDLSSGPGFTLPMNLDKNTSPGAVSNSVVSATPLGKIKKAVASSAQPGRVKAIPQRNGKVLYTTASVGPADNSEDSEGNGSRGLAVTLFLGALSAAGFAWRKLGIA